MVLRATFALLETLAPTDLSFFGFRVKGCVPSRILHGAPCVPTEEKGPMDTPPPRPEHAWLQDFLLGRLDDEHQERAEEELQRSPALLAVLQQIETTAPLLEGVPNARCGRLSRTRRSCLN